MRKKIIILTEKDREIAALKEELERSRQRSSELPALFNAYTSALRINSLSKISTASFKVLNGIIGHLTDIIRNILDCDAASFYIIKDGELHFVSAFGPKGNDIMKKVKAIPVGQGIAGRVAKDKKSVFENDTTSCEYFDKKT
ncbi:GAF domain-containing protein, partial [Candidatus Margulisiibacteriota bacterium]